MQPNQLTRSIEDIAQEFSLDLCGGTLDRFFRASLGREEVETMFKAQALRYALEFANVLAMRIVEATPATQQEVHRVLSQLYHHTEKCISSPE